MVNSIGYCSENAQTEGTFYFTLIFLQGVYRQYYISVYLGLYRRRSIGSIHQTLPENGPRVEGAVVESWTPIL